MAALLKFTVNLTGWSGGPGVSTYYAATITDTVADDTIGNFMQQLASMYDDLRTYLVGGTRVDIAPDVELLDYTSGQLFGLRSITPPASVLAPGTGSSTSRATMCKFRYRTDAVVNGRLLRGGNFLGPLNESAITDQGSINPVLLSAIPASHEGMLDILGIARLVVWHRPVDGAGGDVGYVQSASGNPTPAVLRSRRD